MSRLPGTTASRRRAMLVAAPFIFALTAHAQDYRPADQGQRPAGGTQVLPEQFLRGFDPITVYFSDNVGPGAGPADDGEKHMKISPTWPGQYAWADRKTLQFRPAEAWPPLKRFAVEAQGARRVLATMMSAPSAMSPSSGSNDLRPFRTLTLTFPQALPLQALRQMIRLDVAELPGLSDSSRRVIGEFSLTQLPRARERDPAVYAITLDQDIPEGRRLTVSISLALGDEDKVLWTGRLTTRRPFHLESITCGNASFPLVGRASVPRDLALACGNAGEQPQLVFSAPVAGLTLTTLKRLVRLEPAVPDLRFETYGSRVQLRGRFVPDTLYRMHVSASPILDDSGRQLSDPGELDTFFYLGWKNPFLRWDRTTAIVEANGPRMLPLTGYGDPRADVRIYRVDPLSNALWPFPESNVVVDEEREPPFPGEEPTPSEIPGGLSTDELRRHIRLLGSPLVSRVVDLPLASKGGTTRFGLDMGVLLDPVVGKARPGTYLVGLRRLVGRPERSYVRVQVTNLSLSVVEERDRAVMFVRTLDRAEPVRGARITIEGTPNHGTGPVSTTLVTDEEGRAVQGPLQSWARITRISLQSGEDVLVLNPSQAPPRFASNHWSPSSGWLNWLTSTIPPPQNDKLMAFVFTERPIYRPGEAVFIKGYVRQKVGGEYRSPGAGMQYGLKIESPDGQAWNRAVDFTPLGGFQAEFKEKDVATGEYSVTVFQKTPYQELGRRSFQIEAYRIPTFEVQVASPSAARLDAAFKARLVARYYAGGNVSGQPVKWTVTRRPYFHTPAGRPGFLFASSSQFARPGQARGPETITRSATLDDNGSDEISVNPALDIDGSPRIYRFEATVSGADEQQVTAMQETRALPPFVLGMKVPRFMEKAAEIKPEIIAVGFDDKLAKGQEVSVRLYRRIWRSQLRETNFATGEAKYVTEQEDQKITEKTVTTDAQPVVPVFPVTEAGVYVVELHARDRLGRVQVLQADLFVGGPQPVGWQKSREGVFELSTDKKSYRPGETAKVIVQSPFQAGRALAIIEEPNGNTYQWRDVQGGKAVLDVAVREKHVPNLPVHVVLLRGRIGDGKNDDSRFRPETLAASLDLEVEPVRNQVIVKVDHPDSARPGQKVDLTITLADDQKKALGGEVTLWLVDEAVLSLAKEGPLDPLSRFIERNARTSSVRDTRNLTVGRLVEQEEEPGGDGGEDDENASRGRMVRKNFQTVPYYQATLSVPSNGRLVVPVQLSDDLTNFKVRAVAASGLQRFGFHTSTLHVRLPVIVQPQLPRFVRQGDRFWAGGVARLLEGAEGPASVDMSVKGPVDGKSPKQSIDLRMSKAESVVWPLTAQSTSATDPAELTVRVGVTRKSDGVGDAFEVKIPVLPDRMVERFGYVERIAEGPLKLKPFPEAPRPGTAVQSVTFTSVPGVLEMAAGLDSLLEYPHGCLEQRMSRLYPQVVQADLLRRLGFDVDTGPRSAANVRRFLEDFPAHQSDGGLYSYWPGGPGDVQVTAQVVEFIHASRRAGVLVDEKSQARAIEGLKRVLRSDFVGFVSSWKLNQQATAMRALARVGALDEHYVIELFNRRSEMDVTALADLAAVLTERDSFRAQADAARNELWDTLIIKLQRGKPILQELKWRRSGWDGYWLASRTSAVASVFEALLLLSPQDNRHETLRDAMVAYASPTLGWGSTYDNRRSLAALGAYLDRARSQVPRISVALDGQQAVELDEKRKLGQRRFTSDQTLAGSVKGGEVGVRAAYAWLPAARGDQAAPLKQGFIVSRAFTVHHEDGTSDATKEDTPGQELRLRVGDIVEVSATIVADEPRYHVALIVPFAAGFEPMNAALANASSDARPSQSDTTTPSYVQRLDQENRYYFTQLGRGTHRFHFRVRATTEGTFVHPAPWAEQMYKQDVRGRGAGMRVVVQGTHEQGP
ncbi:MAG: hypothetical protein HY904_04860 [Deltaproteobacteria bacterium]|nr:hypothetical protein [Deltaproteobacteria bacterium]